MEEAERGPNEELGHLLLTYRDQDPQGSALDDTLPEQYVRTVQSRRRADRVIWARLGRRPDPENDPPSIAVEFISAGKRNRCRDYEKKGMNTWRSRWRSIGSLTASSAS